MKLQLTPTFPANVVAGFGVAVSVSGGTYTFSVDAAALFGLREITGVVATVSATEAGLAINKTVAAPTTVTLPSAASRNGLPVTVKDKKGDASTNNITVTPNGTETIDGHPTDTIVTDFASQTYLPIAGGWLRT